MTYLSSSTLGDSTLCPLWMPVFLDHSEDSKPYPAWHCSYWHTLSISLVSYTMFLKESFSSLYFHTTHPYTWVSQVALVVKNPPANAGDVRPGFSPWVGKICWRREWLPTAVFLPGESHGQRSPQRVRHYWSNWASTIKHASLHTVATQETLAE